MTIGSFDRGQSTEAWLAGALKSRLEEQRADDVADRSLNENDIGEAEWNASAM